MVDKKKVKLRLVGLDGNIYVLTANFALAARRQGWAEEEIDAVKKKVDDSTSYHQAVSVLMDHCERGGL